MDYDTYLKNEKKQTIHRYLNTVLMIFVLFIGFQTLKPIYDEISGLKAERIVQSEIAQLVVDEGYRAKPYKDSLGKWTVGFGHLIKEGETFDQLTPRVAVRILRKDYANATEDVERMYPWAIGEVKLVLVNMSYQLGMTGLGKFKDTINYLKLSDYDDAAGEMLDSIWAKQTPSRASRLAGRIMQLQLE